MILARGGGQRPLAGVTVASDNRVLGTSDAQGRVQLTLTGAEGTSTELTVRCPEQYVSPERPIVVGLRQMSKGSPTPRFETECMPMSHTVVVGIRAESAPHVPVLHLHEVVGETDEHGFAHVLLEVAPNVTVSLELDTANHAMLRPQSPTLTFLANDRDEMVLLEQKFTAVKPVVKARPRSVPQRL